MGGPWLHFQGLSRVRAGTGFRPQPPASRLVHRLGAGAASSSVPAGSVGPEVMCDDSTAREAATDAVNEVRLVGRVSQQPEERVLPERRLGVDVPGRGAPATRGEQVRQQVDALECAAWSGRARRSVATWRADDLVEVTGAIRRRFFRAAVARRRGSRWRWPRAKVIRRAASA